MSNNDNLNTNEFCGRDDGSSQPFTWKDLFFPKGYFSQASNVRWVPGGPFGSSRLASTRELVQLKKAGLGDQQNYLQLLPAFAIAHDPQPTAVDMGALPIPLGSDSPNLLAFGRSGSGKTQTVTLPTALNAFKHNWSMVYLNVKGVKQTRFLRRSAARFGREDQVKVISPLKVNRTLACTMLEGCDNLSTAGEVAEVIVTSAARHSRDGEGAWAYNQAQEFLQHAICAICTDCPDSQRNLYVLRQVILAGNFKAFAADHPDFPVLEKFAKYVTDGNRNAETISSTISECTAFIDEIGPFLSADEFSFNAFATEGGCLIIEIDQADIRRLRPIVTLLLTRLISSLQRVANTSLSGSVPNKTVIIVDELIASGPIPGLAETLHTCRELGFSFVCGAQSISQLATIYGYDAQAVLDGFQTQIAIAGALDLPTAEHFSRRTGIGTIAVPSVQESSSDSMSQDTATCNWQLASRPMLLPSEVANPLPHPDLGMPATVLLGDGKTSPFQVYLTPCYREGSLLRLMEDPATPSDDDRREAPLKAVQAQSGNIASSGKQPNTLPAGISNSAGWSAEQITTRLNEVKKGLDWDNTTGSARRWWEAFEHENNSRMGLVLRLAEELLIRKATVTEFFLAYVYSNTDNIQGNLHYLDYTRLKKEEEAKRKASQNLGTKSLLDLKATNGVEVVLTSYGKNKRAIVNIVRLATDESLSNTRNLVSSSPTSLGRARSREIAENVVEQIRAAGGQAHISHP